MNAYKLIKDVDYAYKADTHTFYSSPCRGLWNIVHIGVQVPGCHEIFVCPTSCLRGVVLTTAEMGAMERMSTIAVGEDNILTGDMEECLQAGVEKVIESLEERPRMVMIFISCVHHFLAANYQRVYKILRNKYPDIDFTDAYMDPIMRRKTPAIPSLTRQIYRVLKPVGHDDRKVNVIGSWFPSAGYNDLIEHIRAQGITVYDLAEITDYDRFLEMEESAVNITFHPHAEKAGKDMEIRLKQRWLPVRSGFIYEEILDDMKRVSKALSIPAPDEKRIEEQIERIEKSAKALKEEIQDTPVAIDYTAVDTPLEMAEWLILHGFNVQEVFIEVFTETEETFRRLQTLKPLLRLYSAENPKMRVMDRTRDHKTLAIGQKAAYFNDTPHFVNIIHGEDMYGFSAIERWLALMKEAWENPKDMRTLIQEKGWRCDAK